MIRIRLLSILLIWPTMSLWGQPRSNIPTQPPPTAPSPDRSNRLLFAQDLDPSQLKPNEKLPKLERTITVEEMGIRVPPPPASPNQASTRIREIRQECAEALAYLNREYELLLKDQAADIATLRAHPDWVSQGMKSPQFKTWYVLSKEPTITNAELAFISDAKNALVHDDVVRSNSAGAMNGVQALVPGETSEFFEGDDHRIIRMMVVGDNQRFLDQYLPIYQSYKKVLDAYIAQVADNLNTPESKLPLSTLVLARLCKIRIFNSYMNLTKLHYQVWTRSSTIGALGPMPHDVTYSEIVPYKITPRTPKSD